MPGSHVKRPIWQLPRGLRNNLTIVISNQSREFRWVVGRLVGEIGEMAPRGQIVKPLATVCILYRD